MPSNLPNLPFSQNPTSKVPSKGGGGSLGSLFGSLLAAPQTANAASYIPDWLKPATSAIGNIGSTIAAPFQMTGNAISEGLGGAFGNQANAIGNAAGSALGGAYGSSGNSLYGTAQNVWNENLNYMAPWQNAASGFGSLGSAIANSVNSAFQSPQQSNYGYGQPYYNLPEQQQYQYVGNYRPPTLHDQGIAGGYNLATTLFGQNQQAPYDVANQVNSAFDSYQDNVLKNKLIDMLGGALGGGGGGNRMMGFRDTNSPQYAALPGAGDGQIGTYGTNVTAGPIPQQQVQQAMSAATGAAGAAPAGGGGMPSSVPGVSQQAARELNNQRSTVARGTAANQGVMFDRDMAKENAGLKLASEQGRAQQGLDLASLLTQLQGDQVSRDVALQRARYQAVASALSGLV